MKRFWNWIRSWRAMLRHSRAVSLAAEWVRRSDAVAKRLERNLKRLRRLKAQFDLTAEAAMEDIEAATNLQRQQEHVVDGLREENDVMSKIIIPQLTAAHKLVLERWDADTAIQTRLRMANRPFIQEE